jgi:hypothetical protein
MVRPRARRGDRTRCTGRSNANSDSPVGREDREGRDWAVCNEKIEDRSRDYGRNFFGGKRPGFVPRIPRANRGVRVKGAVGRQTTDGPAFSIMSPVKKIPPAVWVFLLPLALGAPFVGRAYFVDDHYHVLMARGLLDHPARPYDFVADDAGPAHRGWERGQPPRMVNPPLHHYALAIFWKITGGRLWAVRLLSLLFSGGAALLIYLLARRFVVPPVPAAVLSALAPAFWLSSYGLLIDSTMLFFFLAGLWAWTEGLARRSMGWLTGAGVVIGLAVLTKYTAGYAGILALLYWALAGPRPRWKTAPLFLGIPAAVLGVWSLWNVATYGAPHFTESSKRVMQSFAWSHVLVFLSFLTGSLGIPFFLAPRTRRGVGVAGTVAGGLIVFFVFAGFTPFQSGFFALLVVLGAVFSRGPWGRRGPVPFPRGSFSGALAAVGDGADDLGDAMGGRPLLPDPFAAGGVPVFARAGERRAQAPEAFGRAVARTAVALFVFGSGLAAADWFQAQTGRRIAADLRADAPAAPSGRKFILWDSFRAGDLLKGDGWRPAFPETVFQPGDLLLRPEVIMPPWWFGERRPPLALRKIYDYPSAYPVRVMDNRGAAGFYASAWGPLPFTLSRSPLERYGLFEVLSKENP